LIKPDGHAFSTTASLKDTINFIAKTGKKHGYKPITRQQLAEVRAANTKDRELASKITGPFSRLKLSRDALIRQLFQFDVSSAMVAQNTRLIHMSHTSMDTYFMQRRLSQMCSTTAEVVPTPTPNNNNNMFFNTSPALNTMSSSLYYSNNNNNNNNNNFSLPMISSSSSSMTMTPDNLSMPLFPMNADGTFIFPPMFNPDGSLMKFTDMPLPSTFMNMSALSFQPSDINSNCNAQLPTMTTAVVDDNIVDEEEEVTKEQSVFRKEDLTRAYVERQNVTVCDADEEDEEEVNDEEDVFAYHNDREYRHNPIGADEFDMPSHDDELEGDDPLHHHRHRFTGW